MYTSTIITTILAASASLVAAAPTKRDSTYHGISININAAPSGQTPIYEPAPCELNVLTVLGDSTSASELIFDVGVESNVDIATIECRAFKDQEGVTPGSAPFNYKSPAELSTNLVTVGSILCYEVTEAEYNAF